ncbi:efflux RND transporter periplasmic adaptor subunit [Cetobacterium sp. ZWU0022]|uniref:efflux RND transporter periplasmic adaptor subunit n=1 Tax=Cetobacterium sp. ZWU0022 TaxID=1340502 RepID=UPI000647C599|nr:efflux RND transporter periplasmic adaptor subunit [Cetobacterium sp. ZWU0022]
MKKILSALLLTLALVGCGSDKKTEVSAPEVVKDVKLQELKTQTVNTTKTYNGDIKPKMEIGIVTPTGGYVKDIKYKNGDSVQAGATILTLTDAATEASYYEAEGTLIKAKSSYNTNKTSFDKYSTLFNKKLISEELYLESKNKMESSLGDLKIAEASYIRANDNFKRLFVTSSISGVVTDLNVKKDEKINSVTNLVTVVQNDEMEIVVAISPEDIGGIYKGKAAKVTVSATNKTVIGSVSEINLSANSDTKRFEVKIALPNEDKTLLKGMYGKVEMVGAEVNGLFVQKEAVMIKDLYSYVAIVRDGVVSIYKVNRGVSEGNLQEIFFNEFKEGDQIVVQGQYLLNNNDKVREI